jgi:hypothetical protein
VSVPIFLIFLHFSCLYLFWNHPFSSDGSAVEILEDEDEDDDAALDTHG